MVWRSRERVDVPRGNYQNYEGTEIRCEVDREEGRGEDVVSQEVGS